MSLNAALGAVIIMRYEPCAGPVRIVSIALPVFLTAATL
jgi:hypothetical protein